MSLDRYVAAIAAMLLAPAAWAQPMPPMTAPADTAMMAGMQTMQHDMAAAPVTGDPDRDFVAMMIPHHQGAIAMAQVELRYGKDPALRTLANRIIAAQQREIASMQQWQHRHSGN